jgi:hypothetical protein
MRVTTCKRVKEETMIRTIPTRNLMSPTAASHLPRLKKNTIPKRIDLTIKRIIIKSRKMISVQKLILAKVAFKQIIKVIWPIIF